MLDERLVVVGASLAGLRAVEAARKIGYAESITLVGAERYVPYDRPPLSKAYLGEDAPNSVEYRTEKHLRDELSVNLRLATRATGLDPHRQVVQLGNEELPYTALIIATGGWARTLPGANELSGVHTLRTVDDAHEVRTALDGARKLVVVGAGFIGSEVASSARKRGLDVTIVEALPVPLVRSVGEDVGTACAELHRTHGTKLRCGVKVTGLEGDQHVQRVQLDDGTTLEADLVVVGTGVQPATGWLKESGLRLHERDGGIICNETLNAGFPGVYAAGDVVHWPHPLFDGEMIRLEHWTNAAEQGALAAQNALDPDSAKPAKAVPYFWSDWYDSKIQFVGIPAADEIRVISEERGDSSFLALYRTGDRLTGALTIDRPNQIMKYRRKVADRASWQEALEYAGVG